MRYRLRTLLIVVAVGLPALADDTQNDPFKLVESGKELLNQGQWERGLEFLRRADAIASKGMEIPDFARDEPSALSATLLEFGTKQVRNMLTDRPNMAKHIHEEDVIFRWAARKFGGEEMLNRLYWSSRQPKSFRAEHAPPKNDFPGEIRIKLNFGAGHNPRPLSFEELWSCAIFELNNASNAAAFLSLHAKLLDGNVSRTAYVEENFRLEHLATAKTRRFYLSVFSKKLKAESLDANLDYWFFTDSFLGDWQRALRFYDNPRYYPWSVYGGYYDAYEAARITTK